MFSDKSQLSSDPAASMSPRGVRVGVELSCPLVEVKSGAGCGHSIYTICVRACIYTYMLSFFLVGCASSIWSYLRIRVDNAGTYSLPKLMLADPTCGDVGLFVVAE